MSCEEEQGTLHTRPSDTLGNLQRPFPQGVEINAQQDLHCWVTILRGRREEGQLRGTNCTVPIMFLGCDI